jgi:hypothetical protein
MTERMKQKNAPRLGGENTGSCQNQKKQSRQYSASFAREARQRPRKTRQLAIEPIVVNLS